MTLAPMNAASPQTAPPTPVHTAPPQAGRVLLGRTLPSLLDEACKNNPNPRAFNQRTHAGWQALATDTFRDQAEALALSFAELGLERGDRVAFYTQSDLSFCLPDMACLIMGAVGVPLYLTHGDSAIRFILGETQAKLMVVSDPALLREIAPQLRAAKIRSVLLSDPFADPSGELPELARSYPELTLHTLRTLVGRGRARRQDDPGALERLRDAVQADDLATIIYTSGTTGTPKGVMLTQENISSNALAAFSGLPGLKRGGETVLSFLPLTHTFARTLHYGYVAWGSAVYFSTPEAVREDLREVQPTTLATVPRVLERVFEGILKAGGELSGVKKSLFDWSLSLAQRFDPERGETHLYSTQRRAADKLIFAKWREALGKRLRLIIVGGAALRPELVRVFGAAGMDVLQGYGLTETSPIISYNRPGQNRPGTVGQLLAGAEVKLSPQGEILTRGPHVMKGYFNNPEETEKVRDKDGWLYTGDLGEMSDDGFLKVTGRLKNIFKLSTGKYVTPQPLEARLEESPHIEHALVVGEGEKYTAALLFLHPDFLHSGAKPGGLEEELKKHLREANREMPEWSQVKRALVLQEILSIGNDLLTPTLKVKRPKVLAKYQRSIAALFGHEPSGRGGQEEQGDAAVGTILDLEEA